MLRLLFFLPLAFNGQACRSILILICVFYGFENSFSLKTLNAQESQAQLDLQRQKKGVYIAPLWLQGQQHFTAGKDNEISSKIGGQGGIRMGGDFWADDQRGLYLKAQMGLNTEIKVPNANSFQYHQHKIAFGGRYRIHFGEHAKASALLFSIGLNAILQRYEGQKQLLFVDQDIFGPEAQIAYEWTLSSSFWLRIGCGIGLPFLVREKQADSGELVNFIAYQASLETIYQISTKMALQLQVDFYQQSLAFNGVGSRIPGAKGALINDQYLMGAFGVRYLY
jgi:hypothetical protein